MSYRKEIMKYICIYCSAQDIEEKYVSAAKEFCTLLGKHGYGLVWGGSDTGLMKVIADTVQENGGKLIGVSIEVLKDVARKNADEMIMTKDLGERKGVMRDKADGFVALTGGTGTLDELSGIIEEKKLGYHSKPIIVLNTDHFYDGLFAQYKRMNDEGFLVEAMEKLFFISATPEEAIQYLDDTFLPAKA